MNARHVYLDSSSIVKRYGSPRRNRHASFMRGRDRLTILVQLLEALAPTSQPHTPVKAYRLKERLGLSYRGLQTYLRLLERHGLVRYDNGDALTPKGYAHLADAASVRRVARAGGPRRSRALRVGAARAPAP